MLKALFLSLCFHIDYSADAKAALNEPPSIFGCNIIVVNPPIVIPGLPAWPVPMLAPPLLPAKLPANQGPPILLDPNAIKNLLK
jgi:hypothetical protein